MLESKEKYCNVAERDVNVGRYRKPTWLNLTCDWTLSRPMIHSLEPLTPLWPCLERSHPCRPTTLIPKHQTKTFKCADMNTQFAVSFHALGRAEGLSCPEWSVFSFQNSGRIHGPGQRWGRKMPPSGQNSSQFLTPPPRIPQAPSL